MLATINPDKYDVLSKTELKDQLKDQLKKRDTKALVQTQEAKSGEHRVLQLGTTAAVALLTSLLYQKKPGLESP